MGTQTWGTGIDTFGINFSDSNVSSDWTTADASEHPIAAYQCKELKAYFTSAENTGTTGVTSENMPLDMKSISGSNCIIIHTNDVKAETGFFSQACLLWNDGTNKHVITDVSDIQRLVWKPAIIAETKTRNKPDGTPLTYTTYTINTTNNQGTMDIFRKTDSTQTVITNRLIMPWLINPDYTTKLMNHFSINNSDAIDYWGGSTTRQNCTYYQGGNQNRHRPKFTVTDPLPNGNNLTFVIPSDDGNFVCEISYSTNNFATVGCNYKISSEHMLKLWLASSGLKFQYNNKMYKPIVENGVITGYTDDMEQSSEWDNWHDYTDHIVPVTPPTPSGGNGDQLNDMLSRGQFYGSGLMTYYINPPESKLQKALGSWDNISTGKDVIQNLVSYKALCFPSSTFTSGVLQDFTIAGVALKDEQENTIQAATVTKMGGVSLPSITIPKTFNDFRDYAPYTKITMYVPLCGWFELPSWCMGRTINGEMYINPYGGTVKCIVRADGNVVAELGGNAAIDLPFNATAVGMKTAAVLSNISSTAGATARAIMLPSPNTVAGVGSSALGLTCSLNANYTESKGVMGDSSNITGLYSVYIKISRPATIDSNGNDIKTIPETYKHENGLPCNKQLKLQIGDGYTQVLNPNITGSMSATEKQMIEEGFRHGLIL